MDMARNEAGSLRRRRVARMAAALVVAGVAMLGLADRAGAQCIPAIKQRGELLVGVGLMGTKPYVWKDEKTGKYEGFEPAMLDYITKRIGIPKWDYVVTEWTTLIPGLKSQRWDMIFSSMSVTQERIQNAGIVFSQPYFLLYDDIIVTGDSPIHSMADLKGKTLGSTLGTLDANNMHNLVAAGVAGDMKEFNDFAQPFVALRNKQIDAVVMDQATFLGMKDTMPDIRTVGPGIPYKPKAGWEAAEAKAPYIFGGTAVGMRKECTDLLDAVNQAFDAMNADGTRKKILESYNSWTPEQARLMK